MLLEQPQARVNETRSSGREVRIRVPAFFSGGEASPNKRVRKGTTAGGPRRIARARLWELYDQRQTMTRGSNSSFNPIDYPKPKSKVVWGQLGNKEVCNQLVQINFPQEISATLCYFTLVSFHVSEALRVSGAIGVACLLPFVRRQAPAFKKKPPRTCESLKISRYRGLGMRIMFCQPIMSSVQISAASMTS